MNQHWASIKKKKKGNIPLYTKVDPYSLRVELIIYNGLNMGPSSLIIEWDPCAISWE